MIKSIVPKLPFIDKQKTLDFYVNHLEFTLRSDYGDYLIMDLGDVELQFFSFPALIPTKSDFMIYLRMDEGIEALYDKLSKSSPSVRVSVKLESKPWGQKEFSIIDPNGTCLTIGQSYP